jgi:hypothetical protein
MGICNILGAEDNLVLTNHLSLVGMMVLDKKERLVYNKRRMVLMVEAVVEAEVVVADNVKMADNGQETNNNSLQSDFDRVADNYWPVDNHLVDDYNWVGDNYWAEDCNWVEDNYWAEDCNWVEDNYWAEDCNWVEDYNWDWVEYYYFVEAKCRFVVQYRSVV